MKVRRLTVDFYLHGCSSKKEKRRRLSKLRDKFGRQTGLAVCESGHADNNKQGEWTFIAAASDGLVVEQMLADVEEFVKGYLDAEVVGLRRDWLV
jgi:uncharacterized protein YlxP (DUF503 family)